MKKLYSIGEVLIDFIPHQKGIPLKDVVTFDRVAGGAPANVAAAVAKLGGKASVITKLGQDAFGDFLIDQLANCGVETDKIKRTNKANTGLAFVSLKEDGERDFSFYRNPSADLLFSEKDIDLDWFDKGDILHFCSVDLVESSMKYAHKKAIKLMREKGGLISFDPNVRLPLWNNHNDCKKAINEFLIYANILKIAEDELMFITDIKDELEAINTLFINDVKVIIITRGSRGATMYLKNNKLNDFGYKVKVEDTTGAGDAFIGGFLYKLLEKEATLNNLEAILKLNYEELLQFANACGALTTMGKGAIFALPNKNQVIEFLKHQN